MSALRQLEIESGKTSWNLGDINRYFWRWYDEHVKDVVFKKTIIVFKVTILVKDIKPVFVMLFGEKPIV
jgi:hypothetical protein